VRRLKAAWALRRLSNRRTDVCTEGAAREALRRRCPAGDPAADAASSLMTPNSMAIATPGLTASSSNVYIHSNG
jgi:hypothetical protein